MPNKILIADDEVELTKAMEEVLALMPPELEAQVLVANKSSEIMPIVDQNPDIKLIYLDIIFPGEAEDGLDILAKIRKKYPDIKVIVLTAASTPERMIRALLDYKTYEYLQKPIQLKTFMYLTEGILTGRYRPTSQL